MLIKKTLYKLDENGFFIDYEEVEVEYSEETKDITNIPKGYVLNSWTQQELNKRWFKPRYDFELHKWVESLTEEEIREFDKKLQIESKSKEENEIEQLKMALAELTMFAMQNNMGGM